MGAGLRTGAKATDMPPDPTVGAPAPDSTIAAVPAARLMAIRQKGHIVHIDHQKILRPAAPLPDPAQAIRQDPLLQHIEVLFAARNYSPG